MKLSAGAQAVREAGYGSLKTFREFRETPLYTKLAERWALANGVSVQSTRNPRSRFARAMGRAFWKNGRLRTMKERKSSLIAKAVPKLPGEAGQHSGRYLPQGV